MKLIHISKIEGIIFCVTNLHIGSSKDTIEIGGLDNPIIKHPVTHEPYIPGSSLKGKMRSSIERSTSDPKDATDKLGVCICGKPTCSICVVFGSRNNGTADDLKKPRYGRDNQVIGYYKLPALGPTRLIVRDAPLTPDSRKSFETIIEQTDQDYAAIKYENVISRTTGRADHPRPTEFVPAGTEFSLNISLLIYDEDEGKGYVELVKSALRLVEDTYLGGLGSRGYGQVEFRNLTIDGEPFALRNNA